jgi:hypothetical protein
VHGKAEGHEIFDWWANVDGYGCSMTEWMWDGFIAAGAFGHVFHYMDRDKAPAGTAAETAADASQPYLRIYLPLDVPDWVQNDRGELIGVKLLEPIPRTSLKEAPIQNQARQRLVDETTWEVYDPGSLTPGDQGQHGFGTLPVVVQYAKRRRLEPLIGQPILGDPNSYIRLYNLDSEISQILRGQTFGVLNAPLGTGDQATDVAAAKTMMGDEKGVDNVLFTPLPAQYVQPETENVTVYQAERSDLLRRIYRLAAAPWESDSKDAEAQGSLQLKREDMNQVLTSYADQCERTEIALAKLWFRARYGADAWESEWERADVVITYPETFEETPFAEIIEQAQAATTLEMGPTFMNEVRKRLVPKFLPDVAPEIAAKIEKELEQTEVKSPAQQKLEEMALRFSGQPGAQPEPVAA